MHFKEPEIKFLRGLLHIPNHLLFEKEKAWYLLTYIKGLKIDWIWSLISTNGSCQPDLFIIIIYSVDGDIIIYSIYPVINFSSNYPTPPPMIRDINR